jgi:hypothetical protein
VNDTPHHNDIDPGEPVAELADLQLKPSLGFFDRLRSAIDRRVLGVECVDVSRNALAAMFCEFWAMIMSLFIPTDGDERGDRS